MNGQDKDLQSVYRRLAAARHKQLVREIVSLFIEVVAVFGAFGLSWYWFGWRMVVVAFFIMWAANISAGKAVKGEGE